jgi:hypothetical protein
MKNVFLIFVLLLFGISCDDPSEDGAIKELNLLALRVGTYNLLMDDLTQVPTSDRMTLTFSCPVNPNEIDEEILIRGKEGALGYRVETFNSNQTISLILDSALQEGKKYSITITNQLSSGECRKYKGIEREFITKIAPLELNYIKAGDIEADMRLGVLSGLGIRPVIKIDFSDAVSKEELSNHISLTGVLSTPSIVIDQVEPSMFRLSFNADLEGFSKYNLILSENLVSRKGATFEGALFNVYTDGDTTKKFPEITDEELLTKIQEQTFRYFWDFGHPVSGLARERNTSGDVVTSGGSGFGIMAIPVGIERGFITRTGGIDRLETIIDFLASADRFHGAWSHWMNGNTGEVIPFSSKDDGGDLVETSFMAMGLVTVRQYLNPSVSAEKNLIIKINALLDAIEWDWYTQGENSLTWHWSPNFGFEKNHKIRGWNEALITYVMAASSRKHGISKEVYAQGWARNGNMMNGTDFYGITLPLGPNYGGPLFFEHYSYLGIDPRNLKDQYADYWNQAVKHTQINRQHCIVNPYNYVGYSNDCWGLTASDGNQGYSAHSPTNDRGVIAPTAAVSSIPFTPDESMDAIRHFYYLLGDRTWGPYGFYDAFNITANWYATSNIAIDQGPIIIMIENYRTGLLWDLFMSAPEIKQALTKLGFSY